MLTLPRPLLPVAACAAFSLTSGAAACQLTPHLQETIAKNEQRYAIPSGLLRALIQKESSYCVQARSSRGAIGLGQLLPSTARLLKVNPYDPDDNVRGAAMYLSQQYQRFNDWNLALAAYNAGTGNVIRYGGIPPFRETQQYVVVVNRYYGQFSASSPVVMTAGSRQEAQLNTGRPAPVPPVDVPSLPLSNPEVWRVKPQQP